LTRTQFEYARLILRLGETERAGALLDAALRTARELGMTLLAERIEACLDKDERLRKRVATAPALRAESAASGRFTLNGEFWNISFGNSAFQLRAVLGLTYIAHLLRHPGTEFHVTD